MSRLKKILAAAMTLVTILAISLPVSAAGISADEQKVLDRIDYQGTQYDISTTDVFTQYRNMIENWLQANDITADQAAALITSVDKTAQLYGDAVTAAGLAKTEHKAFRATLSEDQQVALAQSMVTAIAPGLADAKITLSEDMVSKNSIFAVNATVVVSTADTVKQTGFDVNTTVLVGAGIAAVLAACVIVIKKQGLLTATEAK